MTRDDRLVATFEISDQASETCREQAIAAAEQAVSMAAVDAGIDPSSLVIEVSDDGRRVVATSPDARSFEARVIASERHDRWAVSRWPTPYGPSMTSARDEWKALKRKTRYAIIKTAKHGQPWPNLPEARIAMGWAWAVLGPPHARRTGNGPVSQFFCLLFAVMGGSGGALAAGDIFAGRADHDDNPVVLRAARKVEQANIGAFRQ